MAIDGFVEVAPDGTGKNIANVVITRTDGVVVYRQELVLADPDVLAFRAAVTKFSALVVDADVEHGARRLAEMQFVDGNDQTDLLAVRRGTERISYSDRHGGVGRGSTR